ncbi:hypothetical protein F2Y61_21230 [Phocaeicola dorei]|uniref:Uncharacterized protein n=1 Tax=Phocaeicola dorei TaxID=357276 RepID=A0A5M5ZNW9_9BACT|nr:hypothetical protein F2Y61_21230 [Phocaeicola dorei]
MGKSLQQGQLTSDEKMPKPKNEGIKEGDFITNEWNMAQINLWILIFSIFVPILYHIKKI